VPKRCGFWYQRSELRNQQQWQGMHLQPLNIYVCDTCYDRPQIQLKTIILPPDPLPVWMPFPEQFDVEVASNMTTLTGTWFATTGGTDIVMMSKVTPSPDPNNPVLFPADF
jgi:hypothetical protein